MAGQTQKISAIILAGGESSRFGQDKAFVEIDGVPLINRQVILLKEAFKEIIIVTNSPQKYKLRNIKIVPDIIPGKGPLGGIYSGLCASSSFYNFIVACDTPFLNLKLVKYMLGFKNNFAAVVPKLKKGYEGLFAIYSKDCIPPIYRILMTDNLRVSNLLRKIGFRAVSQKEIEQFGSPDILFANINTKDDFDHIKMMIK